MKADYPGADDFADAVRVILYGDGDIRSQVEDLAKVLAAYDGVPASELDNRLLQLLNKKTK